MRIIRNCNLFGVARLKGGLLSGALAIDLESEKSHFCASQTLVRRNPLIGRYNSMVEHQPPKLTTRPVSR